MQTGKWRNATQVSDSVQCQNAFGDGAGLRFVSFRFVVVSKTFVAALRSNAELCSRGTGQLHSRGRTLLLLHYLNVH